MPKQFLLKIADPCHEDWDKMTTSEKGKFCGSCQKQVIDFTGMTDSQLTAFFKKPSTGSVCGRFFDDQLDRKITIPRKRLPWIKYFFQITLPLFLASCMGNRTKGKVAVETVQNETILKRTECTTVGMLVIPEIEEIKVTCNEVMGDVGVIVDIPDSSRRSSGLKISDEEEFKLNNPAVGIESKDSLLIKEQSKGNEPIDLTVQSNAVKFEESDSLFLNDTIWTAGMVGIYYEDNTESEIQTIPDTEPGFKIYANPARANSTVFIDAQKSEDGLYVIQLLNLSGQLIKQEQVKIGKGMGVTRFSVPSIPSGNYLVVLLNIKTGKKATEKLIVQ